MAAAPADFTIADAAAQKIKKTEAGGEYALRLVPTQDILSRLAAQKGNRIMMGFAAETQNLAEYATGKLQRKNLDFIAAND